MADALSIYNAKDHTFHLKEVDAQSLRTGMERIAVANLWIGVLMTLGVALVLQSTANQRKGPIFLIQCVVFVLAFIYNSLVQFRAIWKSDAKFKKPGDTQHFSRENGVQVTCLSLEHWIPLIADSALIFKILSFYPPRIYSTKARIIRLAPPVVLLLPRLIIVSYSTYVVFKLYSETTVRQGLVLQYMRRSVMRQFVLVATLDFALQAAFCFMASCALLYKTIEFYLNLKQMAAKTIKRKLRFFMEATFMTFIPPLALSIACAVLVNGNEDKGNQFRTFAAALVNTSVVFSLLATSWSTIRARGLQDEPSNTPTLPLINQLYQSSEHQSTMQPVTDIPMIHCNSYQTDDSNKKQVTPITEDDRPLMDVTIPIPAHPLDRQRQLPSPL